MKVKILFGASCVLLEKEIEKETDAMNTLGYHLYDVKFSSTDFLLNDEHNSRVRVLLLFKKNEEENDAE